MQSWSEYDTLGMTKLRRRMMQNSLIILLLLTLTSLPAYALRCGNRLVSEGDTKLELLRHCGEPEHKSWRKEYYPIRVYDRHTGEYRLAREERLVEEWIYNFGPNRFMQSILFRDGRIDKIESLDYGY